MATLIVTAKVGKPPTEKESELGFISLTALQQYLESGWVILNSNSTDREYVVYVLTRADNYIDTLTQRLKDTVKELPIILGKIQDLVTISQDRIKRSRMPKDDKIQIQSAMEAILQETITTKNRLR